MHNAADDPAIINPRLAARIGRQKRQERELLLRQRDSSLVSLETVNHETAANGIHLMGPDASLSNHTVRGKLGVIGLRSQGPAAFPLRPDS
ncbi:hypothetical protein ACVWWD_003848 [Mesorhizobium sp. URHB0026]